jgi:hypothetical protein
MHEHDNATGSQSQPCNSAARRGHSNKEYNSRLTDNSRIEAVLFCVSVSEHPDRRQHEL